MSAAAYLRAFLSRHGLTQSAGAALLGISVRTMRQYLAEDRGVFAPVLILAMLIDARPELREIIAGLAKKGLDDEAH